MRPFLSSTALFAILACLLWSTAFVGIKIGLKYTLPLQFAGSRFFLAGLLIIPLVPSLKSYFQSIISHFKLIIIISLLQTVILYALFYTGISMLPAGITAITIGAQPLFIAVMSHFAMQNDKLSWKKAMLISLGVAGIVLIAVQKGLSEASGSQQVLGILLLILSNISSGLGNIVVSKQKAKVNPVCLSSWQLLIGGLGLFIISLITEPFKGFVFPLPYYLSLGWLSLLSATAFTIWFFLLQRPNIKLSDLNVWKFIIPVVGALLSWIILPDESPDFYSVAGMIIIGVSLYGYHLVANQNKTREK